MDQLKRRLLSFLLAIGFAVPFIGSDLVYAYTENTTASYSGETFVAMDEDGNITFIPLEEVETMPVEEIEAMDNVAYEVVLTVDEEDILLSTQETEAQADEQVEEVQAILDQQDSTVQAIQEIATVTETPELEPYYQQENSQDDTTQTSAPSAVSASVAVASSYSLLATAIATTTDSAADTDTTIDETIAVSTQEVTTDIEYGVLIIVDYVTYINDDGIELTGHGNYAPDAAYLGETSDGTYQFVQGGATGYISTDSAYVVDYDTFVSEGKVVSVYTTSNGRLYHKITTNNTTYASTQMVGYQQDYMEDGASYYSYDGIYFYTDYKTMIDDYKAGVNSNAINATAPYYNYFQYLSQRTTTNFTAEQIDQYLTYKLGEDSTSALMGTGQDFIDNQNLYGVNALLMLGVAINESGWGSSNYAMTMNNLFGHGAYDTNLEMTYSYDSISDGIARHADGYMSQGYCNPKNWRYYGSNLGNKGSGANVKYASDPYWGEKAAANAYAIEEYFTDAVYDYDAYQIGVTQTKTIAYDEPGGTELYNTISGGSSVVENLPVLVLAEVTYEGELWYKIQSDAVLTDDRTAVDTTTGEYDFERDYVYVKASSVTLANSADIEYEELYTLGDPSGDGKISAVDYMMIKNHIMGSSTMTGTTWLAADVNKDSSISAIDYMMIKNHIMGTSLIG